MKKITIIGGGASGTLTCINLMRNAREAPAEVNLIERRSKVGRGVAFGTDHETHLLNVPAARMGAFPNDIGHFHSWLQKNGYAFEGNSFVPRKIFGRYLAELLNESQNHGSQGKLNLIDDEAIDISIDGNAVVHLASGKKIESDAVVLAFGNFLPPHPSVDDQSFVSSGMYFRDPWNARMYEQIQAENSVFIVGTGLSMVDMAMLFSKTGHRGKIFAISTRGLLPAVHKLGFTYPSFYDEIRSTREITALLKSVRRHIKVAESNGGDWRAVIDSLRPVTQQIWLDLPMAEKRYFKQHLSRYWNVARHRMPAEAATVLDEMQASGQLQILKGRLRNIEYSERSGFDITFTSDGLEDIIRAAALVNCIGSEANYSRLDSPLVKNMITRGYIRTDELLLGMDATPDGAVIGSDGKPSTVVHTLGTALKGILWESTAIPEIRVQADKLALKLLNA
jgi:uncharacterized NAD(P)/FAD-binding protein YdhS